MKDRNAGVARAGDEGFSRGENDISRFIGDAQGIDDDLSGQGNDRDGIGDFIDDPDFVIGASADGDGCGGDGDFRDEQWCGAGRRADVEHRERMGGGVQGEKFRGIGSNRDGALLASLEERLREA